MQRIPIIPPAGSPQSQVRRGLWPVPPKSAAVAFNGPREPKAIGRLLMGAGLLFSSWVSTPLHAAPAAKETVKVVESVLIDQDGHSVKFASEAVAQQIVAINFVYTRCGTVCPLVSATFKGLQGKLGNRLGREVRLISVSLDPDSDTPARLKEYAERYKPAPGWLWLTGRRENVEQVLKGLGTSSANFRDHAPLTLVGDPQLGHWSRFNTLVGPDQLRAEIDALAARRRKP